MADKRKVPEPLKALLAFDVAITDKFCLATNKYLPFRQLRIHYKFLEVSCHGIPWLAGWIAFLYLINAPSLYEMQVNFYIGLLLDIVLVALAKAFVRRRRPAANVPDMFATVGPDVYSFPSGHASRAVYIVHFFTCLYPLTVLTWPPLLAWATSICLSRVLLKRHHILDVLAGVGLGVLEGCLVGLLWVGQDTSRALVSWMTDESQAGGDYHV